VVPELFSKVEADAGQTRGLITRRVVMTIFAAISLLALAGVFGQTATSSSAPPMTLSAPETVRGGLFWEARIDIRATQTIEFPRLVLADGWLEGMQVNSIEPAADSESSRDGRLVLSYGKLEPGDRLQIWMQFEVNPTNRGTRSLAVELDDGTTRLAFIDRTLRVLP
jgi:hypothetical protein